MPLTQLTEGSLYRICQGATIDKPLFQLLNLKKIAGSSTERYRMLISDGKYSNSYGMLATQLNSLIHDGTLQEFAIFRSINHQVNNMQGKKVVIVLELEVVHPGSEVGKKIGTPAAINADGTLPAGVAPPPKVSDQNDQNRANRAPDKRTGDEANLGSPAPKKPAYRGSILDGPSVAHGGSTQLNTQNVVPIASLTPYQNKWTIKARVTHKSDIRRWSNSRGEGHLFSMDLVDESGEIRATAFKEQCDKYYNMIEVGKVFYLSGCSLKAANKQYSTLNNEYEMTFRDSAEVIPCDDGEAASIPSVTFNFVSLSQLTADHKDQIIDVIGVCKGANDVVTITSQRTGKELKKRDITLVDKSMAEIQMTIWGSTAENFEGSGNPVIAIKGAKVSDYNGVSLSSLSSSTIQVNPDMQQSHELKGWFEEEGMNATFNMLTTNTRGAGGGETGFGTNLKTLGEVKAENLGLNNERGEYYSTTATVSMFMKEKALYQACSQTTADGKGCNKKVQDMGNGSYRCEKCNVEMDRFNWRLILSFNLADATDNQWVTGFQEVGEQMLGVTAQELGSLQETDPDQFSRVFQAATFKKFNFRLRCKADNYNDEQRVRHTIMSATKLNLSDYNKRLIKELQEAQEEIPSEVEVSKYT